MDLPFAVDSNTTELEESNASLVTASSRGSFTDDEQQGNQPQAAVFEDPFEPLEQGQSIIEPDMEVVDFTQYVTVSETDAAEVDVVVNYGEEVISQSDFIPEPQGDLLSLLMSGDARNGELVVSQCEEANVAAQQASDLKKEGNLAGALQQHSTAARLFRDAAVAAKEGDISLSQSLLLLSQSQAKSAQALMDFLKLQGSNAIISSALTQKERLRATVRGALLTNKEADISDSMFLGRASKHPETGVPIETEQNLKLSSNNPSMVSSHDTEGDEELNPVDEMLSLERELKDMDAALDMGNSVASLGNRTQNRLKQSTMEGSFMVVPAGASYMSSSAMWSRPNPPRNRANRVQTMLEASSTPVVSLPHSIPNTVAPPPSTPQRISSGGGMDASWWGNVSTTSVLAGSVVSIASSTQRSESTNTKQLMRLLDSIKTLSDENAVLLREVEEAEAARIEAKAAKEQMKKFKAEYTKRFNALKAALEKFRTSYPQHPSGVSNPVAGSECMKSESQSILERRKDDQLSRQEQLIRKLTADLKKEKEESRKKDSALRKYEAFYREVKARSAQKARQRQAQTQQRP
jgi:hypothetical protein